LPHLGGTMSACRRTRSIRRRSLAATGLAGLCLLALSCTSSPSHPAPPPPPPTGLLARTDLLYGSEIGAWEADGGPAVTNPAVTSKIRAAAIPAIRFSVYDCFTGQTCGRDHHRGTQSRTEFQSAIRGITRTDRAVPWLKFLPVSRSNIRGIIGSVFCPPANGSNWAMNLPADKQVLAATAEVYKGPIILEDNNEAEYDCGPYWGYSSDGDPGVSTKLGQIYAATMPELVAYARSLGFSDIVTVGYIGISGGPGWGNPCTATAGAPYGYHCAIPSMYLDEFNNAVHAAYVAHHDNPDYIPQVESVHSYCHSTDFTSKPGYPVPNAECYAWQSEWIHAARQQVESVWGNAGGSQIRFAVSEWSGGTYRTPADSWAGYHNGGMPGYVAGYLKVLRGNGHTTGSGNAYWAASMFELASNPQGNGYNLIEPDGTPADYYPAFRSASASGR
jgi:hypothetical protein